jgi:multidrug efflux pump subunit AcrB
LNAPYARWLDRALRHRRITALVGLGSCALAVFLMLRLEKEFIPDEDKGRLLNIVVAPEGSTSEYTDRQLRKMEKIVGDFPRSAKLLSARLRFRKAALAIPRAA